MHKHSLTAALRLSLALGRLSQATAAKIRRLGHVVDALRRVTPLSVRLLMKEWDVLDGELEAHGGVVTRSAQACMLQAWPGMGHGGSGLSAVSAPPAQNMRRRRLQLTSSSRAPASATMWRRDGGVHGDSYDVRGRVAGRLGA